MEENQRQKFMDDQSQGLVRNSVVDVRAGENLPTPLPKPDVAGMLRFAVLLMWAIGRCSKHVFFNYQMRFYSVASHVSWRWPWSLACLRCLYPWRLFLNALATWASHVNFLSMFLQFVLWNAYCMLRQAFDRLAQEHQKQWIARLEQASSGVIWNRTFTITGLLLYSYSWTGEPFVNTSGEQKK